MRRLRGFLNLLSSIGERAELLDEIAELKRQIYNISAERDDAISRRLEAEQAHKIALAQLEVQGVSLDGMAVIVEQYHQEQKAQARVFAMKGQPPRHDDQYP